MYQCISKINGRYYRSLDMSYEHAVRYALQCREVVAIFQESQMKGRVSYVHWKAPGETIFECSDGNSVIVDGQEVRWKDWTGRVALGIGTDGINFWPLPSHICDLCREPRVGQEMQRTCIGCRICETCEKGFGRSLIKPLTPPIFKKFLKLEKEYLTKGIPYMDGVFVKRKPLKVHFEYKDVTVVDKPFQLTEGGLIKKEKANAAA